MRASFIIACLILTAGCDESLTGPTVPLNREFQLAPGQSAVIEEASLSIRFDGVTGDSRCPADVVCVQGGDAVVRVTARSARGARELELHTGDLRPVTYDGFTIALVSLQPYPFSTRTIQPDEYRATLRVTGS